MKLWKSSLVGAVAITGLVVTMGFGISFNADSAPSEQQAVESVIESIPYHDEYTFGSCVIEKVNGHEYTCDNGMVINSDKQFHVNDVVVTVSDPENPKDGILDVIRAK